MPWLRIPLAWGIHLIDNDEATRHELDVGCWCRPTVEWRDPRTLRCHFRPLVNHRNDQERTHG